MPSRSSDKTVVVDLTPRAAPKPMAPKAAAHKAVAAKPPVEAATAASATVRLSVVTKDNFTRVTFAWPHRVKYEFSHKGGAARLSFDTVGAIDGDALAQALPALAPTLADESGKTVISLTIPAGMRLKQTRRGNAITLAASGTPAHPPAAAAAPAIAAAAAPTPAPAPAAPATAAAPASATPAAAPATAAAAPVPPSPAAAALEPSAQTAAATPPPAAPVAASAPAAPAVPQPPPASVTVHFTPADSGASLTFDWPVATGAAVFRHGGAVWVVFTVPTALDLDDPLAHGQQALGAMAQMPDKRATVLRLAPHDGLEPSVRRSGTAWILDFKAQPSPPDAPIEFEAHPDAMPATATFRVHQASTPLRLDEPDFGGALDIVPVGELGRGIAAPPQFVDFAALPSVQGLVIRPFCR